MGSAADKKSILIVDDESSVRESLRMILSREYEVSVAEGAEQALTVLEQMREQTTSEQNSKSTSQPDLVLVDVMMPGLDGLGLLEKMTAAYPGLPVIMLTASTTVKTAVQAMKFGAVDYLNKPFDVDELLALVENTLGSDRSGKATGSGTVLVHKHRRPELPQLSGDFGCIVGKHALMQELYRKIEQLAERDTTVLITGESGTGKELVAREIHTRSKRNTGPFVALNCAAIPETLIESELFGHEKGSFTHAVEKRIGHFELADGGTLFLDEIGELSLPVQVKMLRFLQEQEFYRIGKSKPISVNVRIVAATNKSLETAIRDGRFRQDLFYRINVVALEMPPLRERIEDVPTLADFFVKRMSPLYGNRKPDVAADALDVFNRYAWPGNVRELENIIESVLALSSASSISAADLPIRIRQIVGELGGGTQTTGKDAISFEEAERAFETDLILKALRKTDFVQTRAAELLGISRRILKYKMDKLGISEQETDPQTAET